MKKQISKKMIIEPMRHGDIKLVKVLNGKEWLGFVITRAELYEINKAVKEWDNERNRI